jgi:hypothetical protein
MLANPPRPPRPGQTVLVPYVAGMLSPHTMNAVLDQAPAARFEPIDPADPYAYGRTLTRVAAESLDLVVVEQDVVPPAGAIGALLACPHEWGGHRIDCGNGPADATLGLASFSRRLLRAHPDLFVRAAGRGKVGPARVPWNALDGWVRYVMRAWGVGWHGHDPDALHLHDYSGPDRKITRAAAHVGDGGGSIIAGPDHHPHYG